MFGEREDEGGEAAGAAGATASGAAAPPPPTTAKTDEGGREARLMELYFRAVPPRIVRELRQLMEKAAEGATGGGGGAARRREEMRKAESRAVTVWLVLLLRMLCWMNLHTFHPDDVQLPKSDLVDSRLPVYIS